MKESLLIFMLLNFYFQAAHCIKQKFENPELKPEDLLVLLGRHDLKPLHERGSMQAEVNAIIVHPNWKRNTLQYDSDIALISLKNKIPFSIYIIPVCLPVDKNVNTLLHETLGTIVSERRNKFCHNISHSS